MNDNTGENTLGINMATTEEKLKDELLEGLIKENQDLKITVEYLTGKLVEEYANRMESRCRIQALEARLNR